MPERFRRQFASVLLVLFGVLFVQYASADSTPVIVGKVITWKGDFRLERSGKTLGLQDNTDLLWGDTVKTLNETQAEILLYPSLQVIVGSGSILRIVGNVLEDSGKILNAESLLHLIQGKMIGKLKQIEGSQQNVRIINRRSISSIRGTEFFIENANDSERTLVKEGEVVLEDIGSGQAQNLSASNGYEAKADSTQSISHSASVALFAALKDKAKHSPSTAISEIWAKERTNAVLSQKSQVKKLKAEMKAGFDIVLDSLRRDIQSIEASRQKDIEKTFRGIKNYRDPEK